MSCDVRSALSNWGLAMSGAQRVVSMAVGLVLAASCAIDDRKIQASRIGGGVGLDGGGELGGVPRLEVTPSVIDLGWVSTGFAARARLSVRNAGTAPLRPPVVGWTSGSSPDFVVLQDLCAGADIAPGQSCDIRLQVVPSQAGALSGTLELNDGAGSATVAVAALGMQAGDLILAPAMGSFEDYAGVLVGAAKEGTFTLSNPGSASTGPVQFGINDSDFSFLPPAPDGCVPGATALQPGQACSVRVAFSPKARGPVEATLTMATEAAGSVSSTLTGRGLAPGLLASSVPALDFDGVLLTESARRQLTLSNGGDEPLELSGLSLAPAGVEGFTIANSTCAAATVLDAGQGCDVEVEFRPQVVDVALTAELVASYAGAAQPLIVPVRGIGLQPGSLQIAPVVAGEDNFGDVLVGQSIERSFEVSNPGGQESGPLTWTIGDQFEVVSPPAEGECQPGATSLVNGQSCRLRVRFTPSRREAASGSLIVSSSLAGAVASAFSGRGIIAGQLQADPEVNFGRVLTAASSTRTVTITNGGDQPLAVPAIALSGSNAEQVAAFTFQSGCTEALAFGQSCSVTLTFAPSVAVPHAATLDLVAEPSVPASVLLLGEALVPGSLVLAAAAGGATDFGDVAIGTSSNGSFTLTNPGAVASGALTITTDNSQFAVTPGDCASSDLVDGSSCTFGVSFTPTDALAALASVTVQSLGAGRASLVLTGRGLRKAALSATGNRDMGPANIGQVALTVPENEFTWTVNNTGDLATGALVVTNDNAQEFAVSADSCRGVALAGLTSCTMSIRFRPAGIGPRTARIVVTDPTGMSAAPIALTGLGVQLAGPGESCINAECETGVCTRTGVCCDAACDRACEVCSAAGVCTPLSGREPCGNGAACFGVDQCKLQEGAPCAAAGGAQQCGSGFCEPRLGGANDGDRICCLEDCAPGLACNAQGRCEQPTSGDGATCGRPGDLPCAANLTCTPCVGSGAGQSQCKAPGVCCGNCGAGLECVNGNSCGCPVGPNGLRGIPCAAGCAINQEGACCPEAPDCDPGLVCDGFDNRCKQCLSGADCRNARANSTPTCNQGTCSYPCSGSFRECNGACIPAGDCCSPADCQGRACNGGVCDACSPGETRCASLVQPQQCFNGQFIDAFGCLTDQECQNGVCVDTAPPLPGQGEICSDQCADGLFCVNIVCCDTPCNDPCANSCLVGEGVCKPPSNLTCFLPGGLFPDGVCVPDENGTLVCQAP